jgi:DNA-binding transcriptional MerR regulator
MLKQHEEQAKSMSKPVRGMTIGVAARKSGCAVSQIRYYEEIGLARPADRAANGRRVYGWPDISRFQLLRRLRSFGLGLEKVRAVVNLVDSPEPRCDGTRAIIKEQIQALKARKQELEALEQTLLSLEAKCGETCAAGRVPACPIIGGETARVPV